MEESAKVVMNFSAEDRNAAVMKSATVFGPDFQRVTMPGDGSC
jgi:hypothetical protein